MKTNVLSTTCSLGVRSRQRCPVMNFTWYVVFQGRDRHFEVTALMGMYAFTYWHVHGLVPIPVRPFHFLIGVVEMGLELAILTIVLMVQSSDGLEFPICVSIVMSGGYEDDVDNSEDVVYTGQGGNDLLSTKKQIKDQKMEKGNLALKVWSSLDAYESLTNRPCDFF